MTQPQRCSESPSPALSPGSKGKNELTSSSSTTTTSTNVASDYHPFRTNNDPVDNTNYTAHYDLDKYYAVINTDAVKLTYETEFIPLNEEEVAALAAACSYDKPDYSSRVVAGVAHKLDRAISEFPNGAFVRTSKRSPKDALLRSDAMNQAVAAAIDQVPEGDPNGDAIAWYVAANRAMRVDNAATALELLLTSTRVRDDLRNWLAAYAADPTATPPMALVVREWTDINPRDEFRAFVCEGKLTGMSQYIDTVYVDSLPSSVDVIGGAVAKFFETAGPMLAQAGFPRNSYVLDLVVKQSPFSDACHVTIIEVNPWYLKTGASLFSWSGDRDILFGSSAGSFLMDGDVRELQQSLNESDVNRPASPSSRTTTASSSRDPTTKGTHATDPDGFIMLDFDENSPAPAGTAATPTNPSVGVSANSPNNNNNNSTPTAAISDTDSGDDADVAAALSEAVSGGDGGGGVSSPTNNTATTTNNDDGDLFASAVMPSAPPAEMFDSYASVGSVAPEEGEKGESDDDDSDPEPTLPLLSESTDTLADAAAGTPTNTGEDDLFASMVEVPSPADSVASVGGGSGFVGAGILIAQPTDYDFTIRVIESEAARRGKGFFDVRGEVDRWKTAQSRRRTAQRTTTIASVVVPIAVAILAVGIGLYFYNSSPPARS